MTVYDKLAEVGITRDRLKTAMDSKEDWGGMIHAFEFLTVLGVVLTEWPLDDLVEPPSSSMRLAPQPEDFIYDPDTPKSVEASNG